MGKWNLKMMVCFRWFSFSIVSSFLASKSLIFPGCHSSASTCSLREYLHTTSRNWVFESFYVKHDGFWISSLLSRTCFCFSFFSFFWGDVWCFKVFPRAFFHTMSGTPCLRMLLFILLNRCFQFCLAEPCCSHAKVAEEASGNQIAENIRKSWLSLGPFTGLGSGDSYQPSFAQSCCQGTIRCTPNSVPYPNYIYNLSTSHFKSFSIFT